jgi:broad specificity phosphatase PhoE
MKQLHERVQKALKVLIRCADVEGLNTIILCTHAATNIALGRALTGVPDVFTVSDFANGRWTSELAQPHWVNISENLKTEVNGNVYETEIPRTCQVEKNGIGGLMEISQEMTQE